MFSFYLGSFLFGAIFILTSILFGGGDSDFDKDIEIDLDHDIDVDLDVDADIDGDINADIDVDLDHDIHGDGPAWLPFLSLRFWTFALFSFGMSGTILSLLGSGTTITFATSVTLGLILGYGIASLFQKLKKNSVTVATESKTFERQEATVLLPIRPNGRGKIRLSIDGQMIDMIATTQDAEEIPIGATIIIVSVEQGTANVTEISQHHHNKSISQAHKEHPLSH